MYSDLFDHSHIESLQHHSILTTDEKVRAVLAQSSWSIDDLPALLSPAARAHLESMAAISHTLTVQRFGKIMQLYVPIYLSNECFNTCTYCGFSVDNKYKRKTLSDAEILQEGLLLKSKGFQHILLLTGESPRKVGTDYIAHATSLLSPHFSSIGIEVQPMETDEYSQIIHAGADSLTLYQETYHPTAYKKYHLRGQKKDFHYRLDAPEKGAKAGFFRLNLGSLLGLYDWRYDTLAMANHLHYLKKKYWKLKYGVSFPRINDMGNDFTVEFEVTDHDVVQFICALRMVFPDIHINLSTRESATLRNHLLKLGITMMSAESHTNPGGYSGDTSEKQFEISDSRSIDEIKTLLATSGYEPVTKDWLPL